MIASPAPRRNRTAANKSTAKAIFVETTVVRAVKIPPPKAPRREPPPRAQPVGEPSAGRLKKRVAHQKGAEYPAKLNVAQMILGGDGAPRDGDIDAVEIGNRAQNK